MASAQVKYFHLARSPTDLTLSDASDASALVGGRVGGWQKSGDNMEPEEGWAGRGGGGGGATPWVPERQVQDADT
jgi:hypothetical protein